ncbi:unnamed protein product [Alopecurus aequalis]
MDGNEDTTLRLADGSPHVPAGSALPSSQLVHSGVCSQSYAGALDVNDTFFSEEGFSYTKFLLAGLEDTPSYQPHTDRGSSHVGGTGNGELTFSGNEKQPMRQHPSHCQLNNTGSSSTDLETDNSNPWNVDMFNDIELDKIPDEEVVNQSSARSEGASKGHMAGDGDSEEQTVYNDTTEHPPMTENESASGNHGPTANNSDNISERDIENFLSNEQLTDEEKKKTIEEALEEFKPEIGLVFETREAVQKFFNMYSYIAGFSVATTSLYRTQSKKRNNEVIRFTMKCNKYARVSDSVNEKVVPQRQSTVISRTDCKTEMVANAKARLYYDMCGDCISFDTTFLTNRYNLPFAPFVGISPHGNTYLFGCAFIVNEQAGTFKWLFEQFLHATGGKHPISIITDADKAMENVIPQVFSNATHRGCLFHVKKKINDKGGTVFQANEGLYEELQDTIDNSLTVHEFETLWQAMIAKHNVGHVKIFEDLWKTRERWVPDYFKNKFFPFIQTTARSEGTNALFKRGVGAQFSFTSFLREYQRIIDTIHAKEDECDHNALHKKVPRKTFLTEYYIESQAHDLYNLSIFRKFQHVLKDVTRLNISVDGEKGKYWLFQAPNYAFKEYRTRRYLVQVNEELSEYSCICCKFEKDGLLCSHILKVMLHLQIDKIPDKYIIDRWRKKEKKLFQDRYFALPTDDDSTVLRFNVLSRMLGHTASDASKNKRKYQFMLQEIPVLDAKLAALDTENTEESAMGQNSSTTKTVVNLDIADESASELRLRDPDVVDTKGRPRLLTIKERIKKTFSTAVVIVVQTSTL